MWIIGFSFALLLQIQAPPERVIVGLTDGQQVVVENPEFLGFIRGRNSEAVLTYRQKHLHGQMPTNVISRIDFGKYRRGQPFAMILTLRNGDKLEVQSENSDFITLRGTTEFGTILIKHPDPLSAPLRLSTKKPDRKGDLTIQYLEFPASSD